MKYYWCVINVQIPLSDLGSVIVVTLMGSQQYKFYRWQTATTKCYCRSGAELNGTEEAFLSLLHYYYWTRAEQPQKYICKWYKPENSVRAHCTLCTASALWPFLQILWQLLESWAKNTSHISHWFIYFWHKICPQRYMRKSDDCFTSGDTPEQSS